MNNNIFVNAQDNYYLIEPGKYRCRVNYLVSYEQNERDVIEFYVRYIDKEIEKNLSVKYIFSSKSKGRSMTELLEVLSSVHPELSTDGVLTSMLYNDKKMLIEYCSQLKGKWLILNVNYKKLPDGSIYKSVKLKPSN